LSRKELAQLEALLRAERARVANEDLIEQVRDEHTSHQTNAIRVTHSKLRAKLGDRPVIDRPPGSGAASMTTKDDRDGLYVAQCLEETSRPRQLMAHRSIAQDRRNTVR
jgi:hypothetical protein